MKLLIITQKVDINDDLLGFMHGWIAEFTKHCEQVMVICLYKGKYDLPDNVRVLSLGKELKAKRFIYLINFYKYIWRERTNYDTVFVHMNPIYAALGGLFWRLWKKKIGLWYTHKAVNLKLRIAEKLAHKIFTASKESFRLKSKKLEVLGHGIDLNKFKQKTSSKKQTSKFKIISVGRIAPIKNLNILIEAAGILKREDFSAKGGPALGWEIEIIGAPAVEDDKKYLEKLKKIIEEKNLISIVKFIGSVPNKEIQNYYWKSDLSVNLSPTGGMDKAVLESMLCGIPAIVLNKTFENIMGDYNDRLILNDKNERELSEKIKQIMELPSGEREEMGMELRQFVARNHSLEGLIKKIIHEFNEKTS